MAIAFFEPAQQRSPRKPLLAAGLAGAAGFLVWSVLSFATGRIVDGQFVVRDAWDTSPYWIYGLPLIAVVSAVAGYIAPRRVWRWPFAAALGQSLAMVLVHPPGTDPALVPVAALFIGVPLVLLMTLPALLAGATVRGGWSPELLR